MNYLYPVITAEELVILVIDWWLVEPFQLSLSLCWHRMNDRWRLTTVLPLIYAWSHLLESIDLVEVLVNIVVDLDL